jgi:hypothetical protein
MKAFSNDNIKDNLCGGCDCTGFVPAVTYSRSGSNVTVTDTSAYPAGAARAIVHIAIFDKAGEKVVSSIAAGDGDDAVTVSIAELTTAEGVDMLVTVVSDDDCISDGHASNLGASGSAGFFDLENNSIFAGDSAASS